MDEYKQSGRIFSASLAYQAVTCDVITKYSFGTSTDYVKMADWNKPYFDAVAENFEMAHYFIHLGWLGPLMDSMPDAIKAGIFPGLKSLFNLQKVSSLRI